MSFHCSLLGLPPLCLDSGVLVIVESVLGYGDDNSYNKRVAQNGYPTVTEFSDTVFECAMLEGVWVNRIGPS
jgi:hypothetical protein